IVSAFDLSQLAVKYSLQFNYIVTPVFTFLRLIGHGSQPERAYREQVTSISIELSHNTMSSPLPSSYRMSRISVSKSHGGRNTSVTLVPIEPSLASMHRMKWNI